MGDKLVPFSCSYAGFNVQKTLLSLITGNMSCVVFLNTMDEPPLIMY